MTKLSPRNRAVVSGLICILIPRLLFASDMAKLHTDISGYVKTFNFFTRTSGLTPELIDNPLARVEAKEDVFQTMERLRLKTRATFRVTETKRVILKIDYDHQADFGSFVGGGDFRIARNQVEDRQFLDLSQTFVEEDDAFYEHRLYRASVAYESESMDIDIGRQQIPWGLGHFFTPTDLFNPFNPTQLELDERDGVDAANFTAKNLKGNKAQFIYTPRGRVLHPQRYLTRISRDVAGFETGVLGGFVNSDFTLGFDVAGNIKASAVRGEFLYREADRESDFIKFTVNADYNFPHNIHGLLEYYFNGEGRRDFRNYERGRLIRGDIQQLAKNYFALLLDHDLTPLLRLENRTIFNMDDVSFFVRPEIQYEAKSNLLFTAGSQFFLGANQDELGGPENLYFGEVKYSF